MLAEADVLELSGRVETLLEGFQNRAQAEELLRALVTLYGEGLRRTLAVIERAPDGARMLDELCADPFVAGLLLVHDLHPVPLRTRIERALDKARPYIRSHGGEVEVLAVEDGVVELRLSGTCDGCPASSATMKLNIEREIRALAPEVLEVRAT